MRAAKLWDIPVDAVVWEDGAARPTSSNAGDFEPLDLPRPRRLVRQDRRPVERRRIAQRPRGRPDVRHPRGGRGGGPRDGARAGPALYPRSRMRGKAFIRATWRSQIQGGAVQGIGWALNEEYIYNDRGQLENPGFLDYRVPVCSDVPMIDAVIPSRSRTPAIPYGVRGGRRDTHRSADGGGESPTRCRTQSASRMTRLPMSPPRVLEALDEAAGRDAGSGRLSRRGGRYGHSGALHAPERLAASSLPRRVPREGKLRRHRDRGSGGERVASAAFFLAADPQFDGRVLVVEREPTYQDAPSARGDGGHPAAVLDPGERPHRPSSAPISSRTSATIWPSRAEAPGYRFGGEGGYLLLATPRNPAESCAATTRCSGRRAPTSRSSPPRRSGGQFLTGSTPRAISGAACNGLSGEGLGRPLFASPGVPPQGALPRGRVRARRGADTSPVRGARVCTR